MQDSQMLVKVFITTQQAQDAQNNINNYTVNVMYYHSQCLIPIMLVLQVSLLLLHEFLSSIYIYFAIFSRCASLT